MNSMSMITIISAVVIIAVIVTIILIIQSRNKFFNLFKRAETYRERAKYDEALKLYIKVLNKIERLKKDGDTLKVQSKSFLACGIIYENTGKKKLAFDAYKKATQAGIHLTTGIIGFTALYCLEQEIIDNYSINIFIHYLLQKPTDKFSGKIDALLSKKLNIDEKSTMESVSQTLKICERILNNKIQNISNKSGSLDYNIFEWVNYYAGIAYFLNKDLTKALTNLNLANRLDKSRPTSKYWLALALMTQLKSDKEKQKSIELSKYQTIIDLLTEFSSVNSTDVDVKIRQKLAEHKLGIFIIKRITEINLTKKDTTELSETDIKDLKLAITYLDSSVKNNVQDDDLAYFYAGRAYSLLKDPVNAVENYKSALTFLRDDISLLLCLGEETLKLQQYDDAKAYLIKCLGIENKNIEALQLLLDINLHTRHFSEVEDNYNILRALNSITRETEFKYLTALYSQNKFSEIAESVKRSYSAYYETEVTEEISFFIARAYVHLRLWEDSLKYFKVLSDKPEYQYFYGYALANLGLIKKAEGIVSNLSSENPDLQNKITLLTGHIYLKQKKYEQAKACYLNIYDQYSENEELNEALGCLFLNMGNPEGSKPYFTNILTVNPLSYQATIGLAIVYDKQKNYQSAIEYYKKALQLKEQNWIHLKLGTLYVFLDDFHNAETLLETYYSSDPGYDRCLFYLGYACANLKKYGKAIELWSVLLEKYPNDEILLKNLNLARYNNALELIVSNEYEKAIPNLVNYLNFFGNDLKTRKFLGQLYFKVGLSKLNPDVRDNFSEIRDQWFLKALSFDDDNLKILFYVSLFEIELKKFNEARTFLNKLISLDPSNYKYRYFLSVVNLENGNRNQALSELKELLAGESNNGITDYSRRVIANEFIKDSNFSEALTILEQLV